MGEDTRVSGKTIAEISEELKSGAQLSLDEIREKYGKGWVILGNCQFEVASGEVMFHTTNEADIEKEFEKLAPPGEAHSYYVVLCLGEEEQ